MTDNIDNGDCKDRGTVVFKPKKGICQASYTRAVIEIDGIKYEVEFDNELKIDLPAKRYEFFCYGVCPKKIKVTREGGTFILNKDETMTIIFKPKRFKLFGT